MVERVLVFDLECATHGKSIDTDNKLKFFGAYSYITNKYYIFNYKNKQEMQKIIDAHDYVVGFNSKEYDIPICKKFGLTFEYKFQIDLLDILKKRQSAIKTNKGMLNDLMLSLSLDSVTKIFDIATEDDGKIKDFDYTILNKDEWTDEEIKLIHKYLKRDLELTKKLYEWLEDFFKGFKEFIPEKDVRKKRYLTTSIATLYYIAACKELGLEEEYTDEGYDNSDEEGIEGGYVGYPSRKDYSGNIIVFDLSSAYPMSYMCFNLFGRQLTPDGRPTFNSNEMFQLKGTYYTDKLDIRTKMYMKWYAKRTWYKLSAIANMTITKLKNIKLGDTIYYYDKNDYVIVDEQLFDIIQKRIKDGVDPREYFLKILLNAGYGASQKKAFKHVYDIIASEDCTYIARTIIKYARAVFASYGYDVVYSDTDSVFVIDHLNDRQKLIDIKEEIVAEVKQFHPFQHPAFTFGIDKELKYISFFKGNSSCKDFDTDELDFINKPKGFVKKHYLYVDLKDKITIKGLQIRKRNTSKLAKKIFYDNMVPLIIKEHRVEFNKSMVDALIQEYLEKDTSLATTRYQVNSPSSYKLESQIQAQIAKRYGPGIHHLIPNTKGVGAGIAKKYCTVEDFKKYKLTLKDIDLTSVYSELDHFIKKPQTRSVTDY